MVETKEYIIEQAYKLFLERSYEAVSISDISKAIGLTKGALYHHFTSKEDLFKAVIDRYLAVISHREVNTDLTVAEYIEDNISFVKSIIDAVCIDDLPFVPVNYLSLLIDAMRYYPGFAQDKEDFFKEQIRKLKFMLDKAVYNGELRSDIDTYVVALNFFSISVGIASNMFTQNSPEQAVDAFKAQIYGLYNLLKK